MQRTDSIHSTKVAACRGPVGSSESLCLKSAVTWLPWRTRPRAQVRI